MSLPPVSHLQFLILSTLSGAERAGHNIRKELIDEGWKKSAPAFYQMMSRLEKVGLIEGHYNKTRVRGYRAVERLYQLTHTGKAAVDSTRSFYRRHAPERQLTLHEELNKRGRQ